MGVNEVLAHFGIKEIFHEGKPMRSGRYPWGSGKDPDPNSPRGQRLAKKESESVKTAKKVLSDKTEFNKMATKDLQDLVVRIGYESQLRNALAKNADENRTFVQKAMRKIGGMAVKTVSDFAMQQAQNAIKSYLVGRSKQAEEIKKAAQDASKKIIDATKNVGNVTKSSSQLWNDIKKLSQDGNVFGISAQTMKLLSEAKKK